MLFFFMKKSEMSLDELMVANELNSLYAQRILVENARRPGALRPGRRSFREVRKIMEKI